MGIEQQAVRVAAAAAALAEDCQRPASPPPAPRTGLAARKWWDPGEMVLGMVRDQQHRRAEVWGKQRRLPLEWLMILAVEIGALAELVEKQARAEGLAREAAGALRQAAGAASRWTPDRRQEA